MKAKEKDISKILNLLSNMYLCKPLKEAIINWKTAFSEDIPAPMLGLKIAIDKIDPHAKQEIEDLLWEYTRLFIGPYKLPCPPWESVYTSPKRLLMQAAHEEVRDFYEATGLSILSPNIMPDHIGAELNFLAILYKKMIEESDKKAYYMERAKKFLAEHLMRWVPIFTKDIMNSTHSLFYKELAQATRNILFWLYSKVL